MRKYIALFILLSLLGNTYFTNYNHPVNNSPLIIQENGTIGSSVTADLHPVDGDGKLKYTIVLFAAFILLTLFVTFTFHLFIQHIRRLNLLNPVFYQSNYVIISSSENK